MLGEELAIADQPRLWLGEQAARDEAFANPDDFAFRVAQQGTGRPGRPQTLRIPAQMSAEELSALREAIEINGAAYVAERKASFATVPSWTPAGLEKRSAIVRLFATLVDGEYQIMPGGIGLEIDTTSDFPAVLPANHLARRLGDLRRRRRLA